jgi:hypothetical protein
MGTGASTSPASSNTTNNGLSDLLQTLSNENSPLLSTLSSPGVESALENAPTSDIVEISEQAQQLQSVDALFGLSSTSNSSTDSLFTALADVGSNTGSPAASSLNTGSSLADQLAAYQGNLQTQEAQTLLGINPTTNTNSSLFDLVG